MSESSVDRLRDVLTATGEGVELRLKVVPGASRTRIVSVLGTRLKITVAAPPQQGQANIAMCQLLADTLSIPVRCIRISAGSGNAQKTVELIGINLCAVTEKLHAAIKLK